MVEIRSPKKGKGVPKETPGENIIPDLQEAMARNFPDAHWDNLEKTLVEKGFFEAGMQEQIRLMAEVSVEIASSLDEPNLVLMALSSSQVEKVRGVAAFCVPFLFPSDLEGQIEGVYFTGLLDGTWPQELSATVLHNLVIQHGVVEILPLVMEWIYDPNPPARRLVTESFRPRAVMLAHIDELKENPLPLREILESLLDDPSDYVRKSVANNLNDISKDNPEILLEWVKDWSSGKPSSERGWVLSRGLRTLVNSGNKVALDLLGYTSAADLMLDWFGDIPNEVQINQLLQFELKVNNPTSKPARIILILDIKEPGKGTKPRTSRYQIWRGKIRPEGSKLIQKKIHFVDKTTQAKLPGIYHLHLMLNGVEVANRSFTFQRSS